MKKILHFKKHKSCNLYCEGCISSVQNPNGPDISKDDNKLIFKTLDNINLITNPGEEVKYSVSFLGGEPLMSKDDLKYYNEFVEEFSSIISDFGIQSNLVFHKDILNEIIKFKDLYKGRLGTSYNFNKTRMFNKSHTAFKEKFLDNYLTLSEELNYNIPVIVVITNNNVKSMPHIYNFFNDKNIDVTFFHFLPMGKKTNYFKYYDEQDFHEHFARNLLQIHNDKNKKITVQPIDKIVNAFNNRSEVGCLMQQDCFKKSFCVEADGNIFVCPELSAQNKFPLGNWKTGDVHNDNIKILRDRSIKVEEECLKCEHYSYCRSGCMAESLVVDGNLYGKTYMCSSWKILFSNLDKI